MTLRTLYDNLLIELNKVEAPSLLLEDFLYFANKAVQQYINKVYNRYDINQQSTDDLRTLKTTLKLNVINEGEDVDGNPINEINMSPTEDRHWFCTLPIDYMHLLNCVLVFEKTENEQDISRCEALKSKQTVKSMARRLTSDLFPSIISNAYFKPSYKTPYYFITNHGKEYGTPSSNEMLEQILDPCDNAENVPIATMEIRCGSTTKYFPKYAYIDYIKTPDVLYMTYDMLEEIDDRSQVLEFPEYVCYEIQNELTKLVLENIEDPRLQTNIPINQTIAGAVNNNN